MKTLPDPNDDDVLLNAILADEGWQELDSSVRRDSLASLRTQKRRRNMFALARGIAACAILVVPLLWWIQPRKTTTAVAQRISAELWFQPRRFPQFPA